MSVLIDRDTNLWGEGTAAKPGSDEILDAKSSLLGQQQSHTKAEDTSKDVVTKGGGQASTPKKVGRYLYKVLVPQGLGRRDSLQRIVHKQTM